MLEKIFKHNSEFDLTSGDIARPLLYLSAPLVVTNLLQTAYNLADTFWLGQYSTVSLAAISFAFPMVFLLISIGIGISITGSVLVAQHTGAGNHSQAQKAAGQTISTAFIISILLGAIGYTSVETLLMLLGATGETLTEATLYMEWIALGLPFMFLFIAFLSLMRGYGDTITPMLVMLLTVIINIALDPFLIFGWTQYFPELGIEGAAIATVASRGVATIVGMVLLFGTSRGISTSLPDLLPTKEYLHQLAVIGGPASFEVTARAVSVNLLLLVVSMFSTPVIAAYGIGTRIFSIVFMPAVAVGNGVETMTGQNLGAGKPDRVEQTNHFAVKAMFGLLTALGVVVLLVNRPLVSIFTNDPEVITIGVEFFLYTALTFGGIGVMRVYSGGFRGAGKTTVSAAIAIIMLGVVRFPLAWLLALDFGYQGVWAAFAISNIIGGVVAFAWFYRGSWRESPSAATQEPAETPPVAPPQDD